MGSLLDYRLNALRAFARTGSFTGAAERLYISQPAVSQQIKSLEADLGMPLVTRRGRRVELTPRARELVDYLDAFVIDSAQVVERLRGENPAPLRIGATLSISQFLLPPLLVRLVGAGRALSARVANTADLLGAIRAGELDLALVEGGFDRDAFGYVEIEQAAFCAITGPGEQAPARLEDLLDRPLLLRERGSGTRAILEGWLAAQGRAVSDFARVVEVGNPATIIAMLERGCGVSFMYRRLVEAQVADGRLVEATAPALRLSHPLSLVYLRGSSRAAEYRRLVAQATGGNDPRA